MTHWSQRYLGLRYRVGANGPRDYDCWNFARLIWRERYGLDLPELPTPGDMAETVRAIAVQAPQLGWREVSVPRDGDGVVFARARAGCHVGVYVGDLFPPRVLHCDDGGPKLHTFAHVESLRWRWRYFRHGEA